MEDALALADGTEEVPFFPTMTATSSFLGVVGVTPSLRSGVWEVLTSTGFSSAGVASPEDTLPLPFSSLSCPSPARWASSLRAFLMGRKR